MLENSKFRAWDKKNSQMMDVGEIHFCRGGIRVEGTGVHIANGWATAINGFDHDCEVVLLQWTGLKDRNGVEIYEGDVVLHQSVHRQVVYQAPGFVMKRKPWYKTWHTFVLGPVENQFEEVVGNIYENPELLNRESEEK